MQLLSCRPHVHAGVMRATKRTKSSTTCAAVSGASRRDTNALILGLATSFLVPQQPALAETDFVTTPSGLKIQEIRTGEGATPIKGDRVVVHWAGFTKNYQAKRLDNTSARDEPYEFILGGNEAIAAFEELVSTMKVGGISRMEVPGEVPSLGYSRNRKERFTNEPLTQELKIFKYRYGPQPYELGGQRALDFVLDNDTLQPTNRTLLFDVKLLAVRKKQ